VVAQPGMENSSTTTQVAWNKKFADPTPMVVGINCNNHTRKLQEINTVTFNFHSLIELLCNAAFAESKYTDINRNMLKQALENIGNLTVLMGGFDEISPTYVHKAAATLFDLVKSKFRRDLVTKRKMEKEKLEKELSGYHLQ